MNHILDLKTQEDELNKVFLKIAEGNTILFLGAGASVGEKRYLSKDIIEYYESYLGKEFNEPDITKFIDILSADPSFDRTHFDSEVLNMLQKYEITEGHKIMASIEWREIITTNYDLLVEKAFDSIRNSSDYAFDIKPIRSKNEYSLNVSNSELRYVKLNGCISDKKAYPLVFSSDDFNNSNSFYRIVLNDLKNLTDNISFISAGYSYSDQFATQLLEKYDSYNFRNRKWIYNIDPFPNENALPYYSKNRICIIKTSFNDFFKKYSEWSEGLLVPAVRKRRVSFTNSNNSQITLSSKLALNLANVIKQLDSRNRDYFIKDVDFYKGEEPNYDVIKRDLDVVKKNLIDSTAAAINESSNNISDLFLPIFFLKGDFGIGKSTFTLRLISELLNSTDVDSVAFEILDFVKLKKNYLIDLFKKCNSKRIILYCDELEIESSFKAMVELRRELSTEQFTNFQVIFLVPIRENILEKYKLSRTLKNSHEIEIDAMLSEAECNDLLEKLKKCGILEFRDINQRNQIRKKIESEFESDSFISLMQLVTNGNHVNDLIGAYNQLSPEAQKAFLFTALLHQFKLLMPAGWLRQIVSLNWDDFISKVIKAEGKGILIQENVESFGTDPDLYFRTKHPIIAKELINRIVSSKDKQYKMFEKMLNTSDIGSTGSYLVNNLLKTLVRSEYYSQSKIEKLHDIAYTKLSEDPYFLLNYSINLQSRSLKASLKKALEILVYAESLLPKRNHRFIHRRAVISFELAKIYFKEEKESLNYTHIYLEDASELFNVKQLMDPFSAYSYVDYVRLLIWELNNIGYDEQEQIIQKIKIEELLDYAMNTVTEEANRIISLKEEYSSYLKQTINTDEYKDYLLKLYEDRNLRPYACILLYNYFEENSEIEGNWISECNKLIDELHIYSELDEIVKFLVKYYGRRLYNANNRIKFFELCRSNPNLEDEIPLRFHYFNFIAESYGHNFSEGRKSLRQIKNKYYGLNPIFHYIWRDDIGEEEFFDGVIVLWKNTQFKAVKISSTQQFVQLISGDYSDYKEGQEVHVRLHFYLYGIKAEIIDLESIGVLTERD